MLILGDHSRVVDLLGFAVSNALNADVALVSSFHLNLLILLVEIIDLTRTAGHELTPLLNGHLLVHLNFVQFHDGLFVHDAGGDGRPLGVLLSDAFSHLESHSHGLVFAKFHDRDSVKRLSSLFVEKFHWLNRAILTFRLDIITSDA